jgi:hypothetical protein
MCLRGELESETVCRGAMAEKVRRSEERQWNLKQNIYKRGYIQSAEGLRIFPLDKNRMQFSGKAINGSAGKLS